MRGSATLKKRLAGEVPYAVGLLLGAVLLVWPGYVDRSEAVVRRNDFAGFWVGARAILEGYDPYRVDDWPALARSLGGWADTPVYGYPGWVAAALLPLAALPLETASALWTFGGFALAALAVRTLVRTCTPDLPIVHTLAGLTLFGSQTARTAAYLGQWSFVLVAALSLVTALLFRRPIAAGILSAVLLAKPHLFVLTYPALLLHARAHARALGFVGAALGMAAGLSIISLLLLPEWPLAWIGMSVSHRVFDPPQTTTIPALMSGVLGPAGAAILVVSGVAALAIAALFRPGSSAGLGVWMTLSLLIAPYQWSYDQLLLLPAIILVAAGIGAVSRRRATLTAAVGSSVLLVLGTLIAAEAARSGTELIAAAIPALVLLVLLVGAWPLRQPIGPPAAARALLRTHPSRR